MSSAALVIKSLAGMLFLLVCMGAALFLPFGSFGYGLAWVYLIVFFAGAFFITVYLFVFDKRLLGRRLAVGPVAEPTVSQKLIQGVAGILFLGIYVVSAVDYRHGWSDVPHWVSLLGDVGSGLAFVFLFFVFKQNTYLSATIEVQDQQRVVSTGLYAIVRHPMYTGASVLVLLTPLALGSLWALIPSSLLGAVIGIRAIDEERTLRAELAGYAAYCQKVKYRFIPYVF